MATERYNTVTALFEVQPELHIKEFSKQYVRDASRDMGFNPGKDTEEPKLSEDTENMEDALFGMEDLRPPLSLQPPGLEFGPPGSASQSESDPTERSPFRKPLRYSSDNSVAPRSSDDGVPTSSIPSI